MAWASSASTTAAAPTSCSWTGGRTRTRSTTTTGRRPRRRRARSRPTTAPCCACGTRACSSSSAPPGWRPCSATPADRTSTPTWRVGSTRTPEPLPDLRPVRAHHHRAFLAAERLGELRIHRQGAVDAPHRRRMRVGEDHRAELLGAGLAPPRRGVAEEEALPAGEPVDHRRGLALERALPGVEGERQAADVGDVLAQ